MKFFTLWHRTKGTLVLRMGVNRRFIKKRRLQVSEMENLDKHENSFCQMYSKGKAQSFQKMQVTHSIVFGKYKNYM